MGFNCGIVGLPNVGKSTLFNALTETAAAEAANYPFCTIEPNTGRVAVPDPRLDALASLAGSATVIPTQLEFVDIAGLVRGASKGEGLGNQFLANIRETDAIAHVLRCFDDSEITHVDGSVDPLRDAGTVETELMLADIESLERRMAALVKKTRGGDAEAKRDLALMEKLFAGLSEGVPARRAEGLSADETRRLPQLQRRAALPQPLLRRERRTRRPALPRGRVGRPPLLVRLELRAWLLGEAELLEPPASEARESPS